MAYLKINNLQSITKLPEKLEDLNYKCLLPIQSLLQKHFKNNLPIVNKTEYNPNIL